MKKIVFNSNHALFRIEIDIDKKNAKVCMKFTENIARTSDWMGMVLLEKNETPFYIASTLIHALNGKMDYCEGGCDMFYSSKKIRAGTSKNGFEFLLAIYSVISSNKSLFDKGENFEEDIKKLHDFVETFHERYDQNYFPNFLRKKNQKNKKDSQMDVPEECSDAYGDEEDIELEEKDSVRLDDTKLDPIKEARLVVEEQFNKRLRNLRSSTLQWNDENRLREVRKMEDLREKFNSVTDKIEGFDLQSETNVNQSFNETRSAIQDLDNVLLSCPQKILVKIVSYFSAAITGLGMMVGGAIAGTKIGALLGLPLMTVSGPIGLAVTISIGAVVGAGVGFFAGLGIGAKVGASVTTWGLFQSNTSKNKMHQFDQLAEKNVNQKAGMTSIS